MKGYFRGFLPAFVISVLFFVFDATIHSLPGWFGALAIIPLITYHVLYLRPRGATLSSAEVDSVYYFGFLVTVAALAATAFEIANVQSTEIAPVLYKFAAGLIATAYAVIARLDLQSLARVQSVANPEQALDSYLSRSGVLLDNLEAAIVRVSTLSEMAASETKRITDGANRRLTEAALASASAFEGEIKKALGSVSDSVGALKTQISDSSFIAQREEFARVLRSNNEAADSLKEAFEALISAMRSGETHLNGARDAMRSLGEKAELATQGLTGLAGEQGAIVTVAKNVQSTAEASRGAAESARDAAADVASLASNIAATGSSFSELAQNMASAGTRLDGLTASSLRFESSIETLARAVRVSEQLGVGLENVGRELPGMVPNIQALGRGLNELKLALANSAGSLESDVERSTRAVALLAENLTHVAQTIIDRTNGKHARV